MVKRWPWVASSKSKFLGTAGLVVCLICLIRLGHATSFKPCYTIHSYSLSLQSVTEDSVVLGDLSKYDGFTLSVETGPPKMFGLGVEHSGLIASEQVFRVPL